MKKLAKLLHQERITRLAQELGQPESLVKITLRGPRPNVETSSIEALVKVDEARRLLKKARSAPRQRAILKRWLQIANHPHDLSRVFGDEACPELYYDTELRNLWHSKWEEIANEMIRVGHWGALYELRQRVHGEFLRDKLTMALYGICSSVEMAMEVVRSLEDTLASHCDRSRESEYWMFLEKAAEFATPDEALSILKTVAKMNRLDCEQPACIMLAEKAIQSYGR